MRLFALAFASLLAAHGLAQTAAETTVTKQHRIVIGGKTLDYETKVGRMPIKNRNGETEGHIGYTYYRMPGKTGRPITFVWNGGPGSASIWLHMGMVGPKRVAMKSPEG
ncbi:MAG: hypothetical protein JNL15_15485, partial [Acinetobacter johnsonii]|nr:hypothetical protein [Acinetobacter johnsonii]